MAYRCGYVDGYLDTCVVEPGPFCMGGYAGVQYAAGPYGGVTPCPGGVVNPDTVVESNVEEYCILPYSCA